LGEKKAVEGDSGWARRGSENKFIFVGYAASIAWLGNLKGGGKTLHIKVEGRAQIGGSCELVERKEPRVRRLG